MKVAFQSFLAILEAKGLFSKKGQTVVEYALVLAVLSVVLVLGTLWVTGTIRELFSILAPILDTSSTDGNDI